MWRWSAGAVGWFGGLVDDLSWWAVDSLKGLWISWEMSERLRELYPNQNRWFCDGILTDLHIPAIHITVYLISVSQII